MEIDDSLYRWDNLINAHYITVHACIHVLIWVAVSDIQVRLQPYTILTICTSVSTSSRQRYVLGDSAMHKMARSTVFISGMAGLGVEIGMERSLNVAFSCVCSTCLQHGYITIILYVIPYLFFSKEYSVGRC